MKTIGFPNATKENEKRKVLIPFDVGQCIHPDYLYFEKGYGKVIGYSDEEYLQKGCHMVSFDEILKQDIICDPKIGDSEYLDEIKNGCVVFGWVHAVQNIPLAKLLIERKCRVIAWENMFENKRHVFYRNNELAGEAGVLHAYQLCGVMPYTTKVALMGSGNAAKGALKILTQLGAKVMQYNRKTIHLLQKEIAEYDVIVNCVLWDMERIDHVLYRKDLKRMKKHAFIIDISCDHGGAIETSHPTTIEDPIFIVDGIQHYAVDHTPSLYFQTFTNEYSKIMLPFINDLIEDKENKVLRNATIINDGQIIDEKIVI